MVTDIFYKCHAQRKAANLTVPEVSSDIYFLHSTKVAENDTQSVEITTR